MNTEFCVLLRTGKLYQFDAAALALQNAGIPHNLHEESVSGLRTAMPIDPSPAPGTWWTIQVPDSRFEEASEVIAALPYNFKTEPDVWDCSPSLRSKNLVRIAAWIALVWFVVVILFAVTRT